jgi:acetyltransferase
LIVCGGSEVLIRPVAPSDRGAFRAGFGRLSETSRYRRFLSPMNRLTDAQLDYLTRVDQHDHVALVAVDAGDAEEILGVARFVRTSDRVAEPAIAIADHWQGKGLGTALFEALTRRALEEGIERFEALVLAENEPILKLLSRAGAVQQRRTGAEVEVEVSLSGSRATDGARLRCGRKARRATIRRRRGERG